MATKTLKRLKVEVTVSSVYDVLSGLYVLNAWTQEEEDKKGDEKHEVSEKFVEELNTLKAIKANLRPRLAANLARYFDCDSYPGVGLLSLEGEEYTRDVPTLLQSLAQLPDQQLGAAMLSFGKIYRGNLGLSQRIEDLQGDRAQLIKHIEQSMSLPAEKVEGLADVVLNPATTREDLAELIEHFWFVIMAGEVEKRAQAQQQIAERCMARLAEMGERELITQLTNLHLTEEDDNYDKVVLAPSSFTGSGIIGIESLDETCLIVVLGADNKIFQAPKSESRENETLDTAQLAALYNTLSDKTRLEIVHALAERPHYGQELAKMLSISNATVFYHLSLLEKIKIVHLERIEHRVYYALDSDRLRQLLSQGTIFLLG